MKPEGSLPPSQESAALTPSLYQINPILAINQLDAQNLVL